MLVNLSNHPSDKWSNEQKVTAEDQYGKVVDLSFPDIPTNADIVEVKRTALKYFDKILLLKKKDLNEHQFAVHLSGELTFVYSLLEVLRSHKISAIASTTERIAHIKIDGTKISKFEFAGFRNYY